MSLRFLAPQILGVIFAQYYSSPKRKGTMDKGFLGKIDGPFICLAAAILCHSLRCWRTGDFIDNVPFTRTNCGGKMNSAYLWFSKVCGSLGAQASGYFRKPQVLNAGNGSANEKTGLLECQIETWNRTEKVWQDQRHIGG